MKPTHTNKLLSLLLALALVFNLACPAFAAELDTAESDTDELVSSETTTDDSEDWDTLPVTDSSEDETAEEETADSSAGEETSTQEETDGQEAETAEDAAETAESAEDAGEETDTTEAETAEEDVLVTAMSAADEGEAGVFALSEEDESWVYTLDEDGSVMFAFVYLEDDQQVFAADGFYLLPAGTVEVTQDETTVTYSFAVGIYYFDADGLWQKDLDEETASVYLTTVEEEDGDLVAEDTDSKVLAVDSATVKETTDGYSVSSNIEYFAGKFNSRYYYEGELYSGLFRFTSGGKLYVITNGKGSSFTGTMSSSAGTYICNYTLSTSYDGCYYKSGYTYTGYLSSNRTYYTKGKKDTSISGWKTISSKEYYFTKGVAAKGTKRIKRNGYTYTYTFRSDGSLVTDLFAYNSSYKKKKLHIVLARGSHTGTILAYNSSTKKYDIPVKSFVISMSRKSSNTKPGTYKLTTRKRWWKYKAGLWYQYATYVSGSGSWTHSEQYSKASVKALKYSSYNGLGTNQSKQCIRMQVVNCKLIYDLAKSNGSNTRVVITRGNGYLPFGKMTLSNNYDATGKVKSTQKYDPTDPAV
ncbi:MAG: L,D-transpeptidase [Clostridiales bacterium]|nr:L,D-transpeptidase [Clostridiales bacterium]